MLYTTSEHVEMPFKHPLAAYHYARIGFQGCGAILSLHDVEATNQQNQMNCVDSGKNFDAAEDDPKVPCLHQRS